MPIEYMVGIVMLAILIIAMIIGFYVVVIQPIRYKKLEEKLKKIENEKKSNK